MNYFNFNNVIVSYFISYEITAFHKNSKNFHCERSGSSKQALKILALSV